MNSFINDMDHAQQQQRTTTLLQNQTHQTNQQSISEALPAWVIQLTKYIDNLSNQMNQLQDQIHDNRTQTSTISATNSQTSALSSDDISERSTTQIVSRPRARFTEDNEYDHSNSILYSQFREKLLIKLTIDRETLRSKFDRLWIVFAQLKKKAVATMLSWMNTYFETANFIEEKFFVAMNEYFANSVRQQKTLTKLNVIRQGKMFVNELMNEIDRLLMEAEEHDWIDNVKKFFLRTSLNLIMKNRMIQVFEKVFYVDYKRQLKKVADKHEKYVRQKNYRLNNHRNDAHHSQTTSVWNESSLMSDSMKIDVTALVSRAKWIDQTEFEKRKTDDRCFRCDFNRHQKSRCSYRSTILFSDKTQINHTRIIDEEIKSQLEDADESKKE